MLNCCASQVPVVVTFDLMVVLPVDVLRTILKGPNSDATSLVAN